VGWVGDVAAEIDRLVVATHEKAQTLFADSELAKTLKAHPGLVNGVGTSLLDGPVPVSSVAVIYPYLPERILQALIDNNVAEGIVEIVDGNLVCTDAGKQPAILASVLLDDSADAMWASDDTLVLVEETAHALADFARTLGPPMQPSAFELTVKLIDRPTLPGRVFRLLSALRYWRADAHRAAWSAAGLTVQEAHALNRLWDIKRDVVRVGQGEERPGRTGVAGLAEKGFAADDAITDVGVKARESIEADTDARTELIYAPLDEAARAAFLAGLQALPIH
jgi:hypothetical protein